MRWHDKDTQLFFCGLLALLYSSPTVTSHLADKYFAPIMSSSDSPTSATTPASSTVATPGVLWVTVNLQDHERRITPEILEDWYEEHVDVVLGCPGNGGLFLRYIQADPSVNVHDDPKFESRMKSPETSKDLVRTSGWVYLAMVKLSDIHWLSSDLFNDMPRTSDTLPKHPDGSIGSAFTYMHAALRGYETVANGEGKSKGTGRSKWLLSLQIEDGSKEALEKIGQTYGNTEACRSWITYTLRDGLLGYSEPGHMPRGMVLVDMDIKPELGQEKGIVRRDVWELTTERGDTSLSL